MRERSVDLDRYRAIVGDWQAFVEAAARPEPTVFRVRTGRIGEGELLDRLAVQGFVAEPVPGLPAFHRVLDGPHPLSLTLEHWQGLLYIQQASTGVAAPALAARPGERVLDLCAAPGGKTTHIAELMEDRGCLVASEISESRIRGLLGNVYRLAHTGVLAVAGDGRDFPEGALFDRVLVDAPCSGEGTLRRREGRAPRQSRAFLGYVTTTQRRLLEKAVNLTRPGGTILYVTCTFAPEENEAVVSDVLRDHPVELEPLDLPVPSEPGLESFDGRHYDPRVRGAARIYPYHLDSGGLFLAKLRREGGDPDRSSKPAHEWSAGWSTVPDVFPGGIGPDAPEPRGSDPEADGSVEASDRIQAALDDLHERFGVEAEDLGRYSWTLRGGRLWLHSVQEWPLESWQPGDWRPVSLGIRAVEFDSRGRPRPTNDLLRLIGRGVRERVVDCSPGELTRLTHRESITTAVDLRGPVALRFQGEIVGRGSVTGAGLASEIPKARASDLRRSLELREAR